MTYRLHDQLIDSATDYNLYILYVMWYMYYQGYTLTLWYYALPKKSSLNVTCRSWLHTCTCTDFVNHNTYNSYTIKIFVWPYEASVTYSTSMEIFPKPEYRNLLVIAMATITFSKEKAAATKRGWLLYEGSY